MKNICVACQKVVSHEYPLQDLCKAHYMTGRNGTKQTELYGDMLMITWQDPCDICEEEDGYEKSPKMSNFKTGEIGHLDCFIEKYGSTALAICSSSLKVKTQTSLIKDFHILFAENGTDLGELLRYPDITEFERVNLDFKELTKWTNENGGAATRAVHITREEQLAMKLARSVLYCNAPRLKVTQQDYDATIRVLNQLDNQITEVMKRRK